MSIDVDVLIVGGGPAGLAAALELRRLRRGARAGRRARGAGRRHPAPLRCTPASGCATCTGCSTGRSMPRATCSWRARRASSCAPPRRSPAGAGRPRCRITSAAGLDEIARPRRAARHRLPRAAARGAPGAGHAAARRPHHRRAAAVRLPAAPAGRPPRRRRRRRARQLLRRAHARRTPAPRPSPMVTEHARHQTYAPFKWLTADALARADPHRHRASPASSARAASRRWRSPTCAAARRDRSRATRSSSPATGFPTTSWRAAAGCAMDAAARAPRVDRALRTSRARRLRRRQPPARRRDRRRRRAERPPRCRARCTPSCAPATGPTRSPVPLRCTPPLRWVSPSAISRGRSDATARPLHSARRTGLPSRRSRRRTGHRELWRQRHRSLIPNLPIALAAGWLGQVDPNGEAVVSALGSLDFAGSAGGSPAFYDAGAVRAGRPRSQGSARFGTAYLP